MLDIYLNGEPHLVPDRHTLLELIAALDLENQALALAVNRNVVPRQRWAEHLLRQEDKVDIVRAIGGG
ncbi:MAG TPA: sulfur carrier protein ThiS [Janthinobacterium sp.]|jgi:sulfur carrier protein|nr:sulfur carrier protein ThiS [Janthinobacterium sp.]